MQSTGLPTRAQGAQATAVSRRSRVAPLPDLQDPCPSGRPPACTAVRTERRAVLMGTLAAVLLPPAVAQVGAASAATSLVGFLPPPSVNWAPMGDHECPGPHSAATLLLM